MVVLGCLGHHGVSKKAPTHQAVHMGVGQVACEFFSLLETEEVFLEVAERFASGFKQAQIS